MKHLAFARLLLVVLIVGSCGGNLAPVAGAPPPGAGTPPRVAGAPPPEPTPVPDWTYQAPSGETAEEQELQRYASLAPDEPYWFHRLAELREARGSHREAELALVAALERDPGYPPALSVLSKLYFDRGRHE